jgi:hypothetical protein
MAWDRGASAGRNAALGCSAGDLDRAWLWGGDDGQRPAAVKA